MICDNNKGKISYTDALNMDIGFLQYLWYKTIRENNKNSKDPKLKAFAESLEDL